MTDETRGSLIRHAQRDSPSAVNLPNNGSGLLAWAAIRWGPAILFAALLAVACRVVYIDFRTLSREMLASQKAQTEAGFEVAQAIREISDEVSANRDAIRRIEEQFRRRN